MRRRLTAALALILAVTMLGATPWLAGAGDRDDQVRRQQEAQRRKAAAVSQMEGVDVELGRVYVRLEDLRGQMPGAKAELETAEAELAEKERVAQQYQDRYAIAEKQVEDANDKISAGKRTVDEANDSLGKLAREAFRGELAPSVLEIALTSTTPEDFTAKAQAAQVISSRQTATIDQVQQTVGEAENSRERLDALKERAGDLKREADGASAVAGAARDTKAAKVTEITSLEDEAEVLKGTLEQRKGEIASQVAEAEQQEAAAEGEIAKIDAANRKKAAAAKPAPAPAPGKPEEPSSSGGKASGGSGGAASSGGGSFSPPIRGGMAVTSGYGWRIHPVLGIRKLHRGVDLSSPCGQAQYSTLPGTVDSTYRTSTGGNSVRINHGMVGGSSYVSQYLHLSAIKVRAGQRVDRNTVIGLTGATGRVTGCHVHFEIYRNGSTINPMSVF